MGGLYGQGPSWEWAAQPAPSAVWNGPHIMVPLSHHLEDLDWEARTPKLQSGRHFRYSDLSTHSEVQNFYHILNLKVTFDKSFNLSEPRLPYLRNGGSTPILARCWTQCTQNRQVPCAVFPQRAHSSDTGPQHKANQACLLITCRAPRLQWSLEITEQLGALYIFTI